jgi:hypothetical protein
MIEKHSIFVRFIWFGSVGAILALLFLYLSTFPGGSFGKRILRVILYPEIVASESFVGIMFSHNRIGPSYTEVLLFNVLFVALCAVAAGAFGLLLRFAYRSVRHGANMTMM